MIPYARLALVLAGVTLAASLATAQAPEPRVLVFSKTAGFRHSSIETGVAALKALGSQNGFAVDATEDATAFADRNLRRYRAVVFLSTTGDVLDATQQDALERFIQAGGGWVGIHSATDTEYSWPWYNRLAGAYFASHPNNPNVRRGTFRVRDSSHVSTQGLPAHWERDDEFYNFRAINPRIRVLVDIDETTYEGGTNGADHPMSWYHEFDGGRAWYTAMGHTEGTFAEPLFLRHLLGGIRWVLGGPALDYRRARPEENRFTKVVLATPLEEPTELAVLPDERVLFIERRGKVKLYSPATNAVTVAGTLPVSLKYTSGDQAEDGLLGLAIDPRFATNGYVYLYYSPAGPEAMNVLARFTMRGDLLDIASRTQMLIVPVQRDQCCHTGGSIAFDARGNLYVSTGDNTNPFANGYAPIDERLGRLPWDAQRSSGNTNDLRGKILRIHPEPDGSYTIPEGNLFPLGTPGTRPEIYTMGHRNPYRIAVDRRTGWVYWGDVGPDANVDSASRGPRGYDEVNQARGPGNFGWPHFVGDNEAYWDVDYATGQAGERFDAALPRNDSPNNTGLRELPAARKAFIWYPYGESPDFPLVGTGGRTAMAGPVFYSSDFSGAPRPFPRWYDGRLFTYEWMRGWIMAVSMDSAGDFASMERFMPSHRFSNPVDMEFGPSGDLYVLEYGTGWFQGNEDARLVRIEHNAGNRAPVVVAGVDRAAGALPLRVRLSSVGTSDADGDSLRYAWTVTRANGSVVRRLMGERPTLTLTGPGAYTATLVVTDALGARGEARVGLTAGNEPPKVSMAVEGNRTFFFPGVPVRYAVSVRDREDGSLADGRIAAARVRVTAEALTSPPASSTAGSGGPHDEGLRLIQAGDCLSCHQFARKSVAPAFTEVAERYAGDTAATTRLARKIRAGGTGVWGAVVMPAHPLLTEREAALIVGYVRSLAAPASAAPSLPVAGEYLAPDSAARSPTAVVLLRATYTDRGAIGLPSATSDTAVLLRSPTVVLASGELSQGTQKMKVEQLPVEIAIMNRSGSYAAFRAVDLTGIAAVTLTVTTPAQYGAAGGTIEVRADSATGPLLGASDPVPPSPGAGTPAQVRVALAPANGTHDLYFVVRNDAVTGDRMLMVLTTATLELPRGR